MNLLIGLPVFAAGALLGFFLLKTASGMIGKRAQDFSGHPLITGRWSPLLWAVVEGLASLGFYLAFGNNFITLLAGVFIFSAVFVLSVVDGVVRKIPNAILLLLLICAATLTILKVIPSIGFTDRLLGLAVGLGIFLAPFFFGLKAGAGDVKYAAVIGFSLGYYYTIVAFAIMAGFYICYALWLLLSKKGNLFTQTALGPYMSLGFLFAFIMVGSV